MNKVYYFTGTGNSLYIAKYIQQNLEDTVLINIVDLLNSQDNFVIEGDRVGFVFPVYFARIPVIIQDFIEKIESINAEYTFTIVTGGGLFGSILTEFKKSLSQKNCQLDSEYQMKMPSNHPKIAQLQKQPNNEILKAAKLQLGDVVVMLEHKEPNRLLTLPRAIGGFITKKAFGKPYKQSLLGQLDKVFIVDESCDVCEVCIDSCPVSNITRSKNSVKWLHHCINCARCYHVCSRRAIHFGSDHMERYINPSIQLEELQRR